MATIATNALRSAPELKLETTSGDAWTLSAQEPRRLVMLVFYRGLHCDNCQEFLEELNERADEFAEHGVDIVAASGDEKARAEKAKSEWGLDSIEVCHGMDEDQMRAWNLQVSEAHRADEPARYPEPGLFLIDAERGIHYSAAENMSFRREDAPELLKMVQRYAES